VERVRIPSAGKMTGRLAHSITARLETQAASKGESRRGLKGASRALAAGAGFDSPTGKSSNRDAGEHNLAEEPERSRVLFNAGPKDGAFIRIDQKRSQFACLEILANGALLLPICNG
jgi:hypothetical protein